MALALYQPNPLQRLTHPDTIVQAPSENVLSSLSPSMSDLGKSTRLPFPVSEYVSFLHFSFNFEHSTNWL